MIMVSASALVSVPAARRAPSARHRIGAVARIVDLAAPLQKL
jgi:hypothetical protein